MISEKQDAAPLEQVLMQVTASGPASVVTIREVTTSRLALTEYHLLPERDPFIDHRFDLPETTELLQLSIEVRVFEQITVNKTQTARPHVHRDIVRRETVDVSNLHEHSSTDKE